MPQHILELAVTNILGVETFAVDCAGQRMVTLTGANGAGKSSMLDAIWMAVGGKNAIPDRPVHDGQRSGVISMRLTDYEITRTIDDDRDSKLTVLYHGTQIRSPQGVLDGLLEAISFRPLDWLRRPAKDQFAELCTLAGLDLAPLDTERQSLYDQRREQNREVDRLKKLAQSFGDTFDDVPAACVSISDLTGELQAANELHDRHRRMVQACFDTKQSITAVQTQYDQAEQEIERLQRQIDDLRETNAARATQLETMAADYADKVAQTETRGAALPDLQRLKDLINSAEATNDRVRQRDKWAAALDQLREANLAAEELTEAIAAVDQQKADALATAAWPVAGLSVDSAAPAVLYHDRPLAQASQAERLRVAIGIGFALRPELRVVTVHDASLIDAGGLDTIAQVAAEYDGQLWLERVSEGPLRVMFSEAADPTVPPQLVSPPCKEGLGEVAAGCAEDDDAIPAPVRAPLVGAPSQPSLFDEASS